MIMDKIFDLHHDRVSVEWMEGLSLTLDGSADPIDNNDMLPLYCSKLDSILDTDLRGERLWCSATQTSVSSLRFWCIFGRRTKVHQTLLRALL